MDSPKTPVAEEGGVLARIGRRADVLVGVLLILVAIATIVESRGFPVTAVSTDIGAGAFPSAFAYILIGLCLLLIFNHFRHGALPNAIDPPGTEETEALAEPSGPPNFVAPVVGVALTVAYVFITSWVGYLIATPVFMFVLLRALGFRAPIASVLIALGVTGGLYLIFDIGMAVALPVGTLFE
ncbi:MAG: tripartite tricarboxylate transporter TctB family protein [Rhodocyclaceae bacterium]